MKVRSITVTGEVGLSRDYQSVKAGFAVLVDLDEGENPKTVYQRVHKSMTEAALSEARANLEAILTGGA